MLGLLVSLMAFVVCMMAVGSVVSLMLYCDDGLHVKIVKPFEGRFYLAEAFEVNRNPLIICKSNKSVGDYITVNRFFGHNSDFGRFIDVVDLVIMYKRLLVVGVCACAVSGTWVILNIIECLGSL